MGSICPHVTAVIHFSVLDQTRQACIIGASLFYGTNYWPSFKSRDAMLFTSFLLRSSPVCPYACIIRVAHRQPWDQWLTKRGLYNGSSHLCALSLVFWPGWGFTAHNCKEMRVLGMGKWSLVNGKHKSRRPWRNINFKKAFKILWMLH